MSDHDSSRAPSSGIRLALIFVAVALLVAASSAAFGQDSPTSKVRTSKDDEARRQVLATDDRRTDALRRNDSAPLHEIYADDYTLVTPATGAIRSKAEQTNDVNSGQV